MVDPGLQRKDGVKQSAAAERDSTIACLGARQVLRHATTGRAEIGGTGRCRVSRSDGRSAHAHPTGGGDRLAGPDRLWAWSAPIAGAAGPVPANTAARQAHGRSRATLTSLLR